MVQLLRVFRLGRRVWESYNDDRCGLLAAGLCYYVFFSIFPLLLLLVAVAGYFFTTGDTMEQALDLVAGILPKQQDFVLDVMRGVMAHRDQASVFGLLTLVWSSKNVFFSMAQALNVIWNVPRDRGMFVANAIAVGLSLSVGLILLIAALAYAILMAIVSFRLPFLELAPGEVPGLALLLATLLPPTFVGLILIALYMLLPNRKLTWRQVLPGAICTTILWEALRRLFGFYIENVSRFELIYGSISGLVGFMFWIFLSASLFLMGAEVSKVLSVEFDSLAKDEGP